MNNKEIGKLGETLAKRYLEKMNYEIITTNFMCKQGEIDIVAKDKNEIVFIEVKTRVNRNFGYAIEAVDENKQKHLKKATKYFIYKNKIEKFPIRFDVIEIYLKEKSYVLNHLKNLLW